MITISINGAEFYAYHGFYTEEQKLGGWFVVDVEVSFTPLATLKADKIANTIDYEQVYNIVEQEMKHTRKLIETVAQGIADKVKERFGFISNVKVGIKKMNPPLKGKVNHSGIVVSL